MRFAAKLFIPFIDITVSRETFLFTNWLLHLTVFSAPVTVTLAELEANEYSNLYDHQDQAIPLGFDRSGEDKIDDDFPSKTITLFTFEDKTTTRFLGIALGTCFF